LATTAGATTVVDVLSFFLRVVPVALARGARVRFGTLAVRDAGAASVKPIDICQILRNSARPDYQGD